MSKTNKSKLNKICSFDLFPYSIFEEYYLCEVADSSVLFEICRPGLSVEPADLFSTAKREEKQKEACHGEGPIRGEKNEQMRGKIFLKSAKTV